MPGEWHGQHDNFCGRGCGGVVHAGEGRAIAHDLFEFAGCIIRARGVARSDNDGFAGLRPAARQA